MTSCIGLTADQHKRLQEIGELLLTARDLHLSTFSIEPRPGSQAAKDFSKALSRKVQRSGETVAPWSQGSLKGPRELAVNLMHQAAIHLDALGLLFVADRFEDVPGTVARSAFEYISRAVWILDPAVDHRVRCARQQLTDLASFDQWRKARKMSIPAADRAADSKQLSKIRKSGIAKLTEMFATGVDDKDKLVLPLDEKSDLPILADQTYLMFTDLAGHFGKTAGWAIDGREVYDALSLGAHPQGHPGFTGTLVDQGDGTSRRQINYSHLERLAEIAASAYYDGVSCVLSYHGNVDNPALKSWGESLDVLFPRTAGAKPAL
ncbi:hypothetical protein [Catellatospora vulcania]|uniref:hypothetical protein n=1 Tax=Catellatospora vulcania TaxID=1460450 RepID=UPI0012D412AC|nr:hypothetical protein [Catellatospora vulcania]